MKTINIISLIMAGLLLFAVCATAQPALKDAFKSDFLVGAALNPGQFTEENPAEAALVKQQFNTITPENALKWSSVHPALNRFDFTLADRYVEFGVKNKMTIIGHNLIWHQQTPESVFQDEKGNPVDRDTLLARMHEHILTVVGRYQGKIHGWDVVNEALNDDGTMRRSPWLKIIGADYLIKAYEFAREADPSAELYYNDYALENPDKRAGAVALLKKLKAAGVKISGIGLQGHYNMTWPTPLQIDQTISSFAALGVKVMITELDLDMLPPATNLKTSEVSLNVSARAELNPYTNGVPASMQEKIAQRYCEFFAVFLKHRAEISRVTFWGVTDGGSWLNYWPVKGRMAYPLLFDRSCQPKPAFSAIIKLADGHE
jgi:endo-1,4-beta-xylanase